MTRPRIFGMAGFAVALAAAIWCSLAIRTRHSDVRSASPDSPGTVMEIASTEAPAPHLEGVEHLERLPATAPNQIVQLTTESPTSAVADADEIDVELSKRDLVGERWNGPTDPFANVEDILKDSHLNPRGTQLPKERLEQLRGLLQKLNRHLDQAREMINATAGTHIQDKIKAGQSVLVTGTDHPDWNGLGKGGFPVIRCTSEGTYYLKFFEGEFSDLDRAMYEQSALVSIGEHHISHFLEN